MSWIAVNPHTSGLGPDSLTPALPQWEALVWNQYDNPTGGTPSYVNVLTGFAQKWPTVSGVTSAGFVPTRWHRGVLRVTSLRDYSFFIRQNDTKHWYRKFWSNTSLPMLRPVTIVPGWDRVLGSLSVGSTLQNKAKTKVMEAIAQSKFDASEALAGARQTVKMLQDVLTVLLLTIIDLRKGNLSRAAKRLKVAIPKRPKDIADAWLQMQYGWRPLVSDAYAAVEILKEKLASEDLLMKATGTATESLPDDWTFGVKPGGQNIPFAYRHSDNKRSARVECTYRVENAKKQLLSRFNIGNPLYLAWVATPYSFLVDWLIPVADWLNGMTAALGCEFVSAFMTQRLQLDAVAEGVNVNLTIVGSHRGLSPLHKHTLPMARYQAMVIQRDVLLTWPKPELYVNRQVFESPTRFANALALAVSMSSTFRR